MVSVFGMLGCVPWLPLRNNVEEYIPHQQTCGNMETHTKAHDVQRSSEMY